MIGWLKKVLHFGRKTPLESEKLETAIELSRQRRKEAEKKISGMIATLDGCGDRWFLQPIIPLDECPPPDETDKDSRT